MIGLIAVACGPSKLEIDKKDTGPEVPEVPLDPVGVIPADDCQQIDIGDKACNFRLTDQNGETWDLYQHTGNIIVLDFSADWCYPCQLAADYTQAMQDEFADEGVQVVTVLLDGSTPGVEPTEQEIQQWVNLHGMTSAPVLQGSRAKMLDSQDGTVAEPGVTGYLLNGFPTYIYIDKDMKFYAGHVGFSEDYMRQKIQEGL